MGKISEIELFDLLKKAVTNRFFESNSATSMNISEWKGQDIVTFQEDIFAKTKSTVSEKWFYTYFKSDFKKLPRIDMLNILAQYAGYSGWASFARAQSDEARSRNEMTESGGLVSTQTEEELSEKKNREAKKIDSKEIKSLKPSGMSKRNSDDQWYIVS